MRLHTDELIPTRATLLARLKDWQDQESWREFFEIYWKLIYGVARKAGLTDTEAQDVVQEVLVAVMKQMPTFKYNAAGSFKAWLLNLTRWRIKDQFRKRGPTPLHARNSDTEDCRPGTDIVEKVPDTRIRPLEDLWEEDWQTSLLTAAMENIRQRADPLKYQIFDCYVNQDWAAEKVAGAFGVGVDQVYLTKHRMTEKIKEEVARLEKEMT
jgi:RNA polymerase sigma-70 factor (ECF subfamily)